MQPFGPILPFPIRSQTCSHQTAKYASDLQARFRLCRRMSSALRRALSGHATASVAGPLGIGGQGNPWSYRE